MNSEQQVNSEQMGTVPPFVLPPLRPIPKQAMQSIQPKGMPNFTLQQQIYDRHGNPISLDPEQLSAVNMVLEGHSCVITGNAGTGKTTTSQAIFLALLEHHQDRLHEVSYRVVGCNGLRWEGPSIACVAASNKAVRNMRKKVLSHPYLREQLGEALNITTIHNLLEYTRSSQWSEAKEKEVMVFVPTRTAANPLDITHLIVEEASMVGAGEGSIWSKLWDALPADVQIVFMGDICQIPPVGGKPILSYALQNLPVCELKTIHRQALESPIIRQAYQCLSGRQVQTDLTKAEDGAEEGVLILNGKNVKTRITSFQMRGMLEHSIPNFMAKGLYNPKEDIFLCPYNVSDKGQIGNDWLNAVIASRLAKMEGREVYEIKTGFNTVYLGIGDRVMINKTEGVVTAIRHNAQYIGKRPQPSSKTLDYFGNDFEHPTEDELDELIPEWDPSMVMDEAEFSYDSLDIDSAPKADEESGRAASHIVDALLDDGTEVTLRSSGHFNPQSFSLGYAISIHKAQGSEWSKVFVVLHDSHRNMIYRELLYTAMTRAEKQLILIGQQHTLDKAVKNPRIKGNTLKDKIEFFNGGYLDQNVPLPSN